MLEAPEAPAETDSPKILVVDDNADKRVALRAMLAPLGHTVLEAASGRAALALLLRETVAMILMDVRMPTLNGFETAKLCRSQIRGGRTPIIFVTAMGSENGETASAYASGAVDFIFTPVLPEVLRAKVTAFVDLFTQSQRLQQSLDSITELNSALRDSDVLTQAVLDNVAEGIFILDEHGRIESVNRSVGRLFGYHAQEPVGHSFAFMIDPSHREELRRLDTVEASPAASADRGPPKRAIETVGFRRDGSTFAIELERSEIEHGERRLTLASVRDISERKAYTEALEHQALHDGLTGLANRVLFSAHLSRALASARRSNQRRAVLVMDLDGFKQVNDTLGHDRGDTLLRQLGARLVAALREGDTVARLGGDEFAILAADATDLEGAAAMAWKIQQACEQAFTIDDTIGRRVDEHRHRAVPRPRDHHRRAAASRRPGDVCGQALGQRPRRLRRRPRAPGRAPPRAPGRPPSVPRPRAAGAPLPAEDRAGEWQDLRRRGAGALAAPHARPARARELHARGGAHRSDRAGDQLGAELGPVPAAGVARCGHRSDDGRERVRAQPRQRELAPRGDRRAQADVGHRRAAS